MQRVENDNDPLQDKTAGKAPPGALVHQLAVEVGNQKVSSIIQDSTLWDADNQNNLYTLEDD
jgi:hypothetical protein